MAERSASTHRSHPAIVYIDVLLCLLLSLLAYLLLRGTVGGMLIQSSIEEARWSSIDLAVSIVSLAVVVGLAVFNLWFFPRMQRKGRLLLWCLVEAGALLATCAALFLLQIL